MKNNRREFLKKTGLAGVSLAGFSILSSCTNSTDATKELSSSTDKRRGAQSFNMSGYAAPKMETVRVGFIGLGNRGPTHLKNVSLLEGVEIKALCDLRPERIDASKKIIENCPHNPDVYMNGEEEWKKLCRREDIDLIYIATPWELHVPMAIYAMEQGKHVAIEVPAAKTLDECWQLVESSEKTRKHCVMLENVCYGFFELLTLNMARQGFFGEIIHGEGAYIHDLLEGNFSKDKYYDMWRLKENIGKDGNLYPTHGLGPICQIMNINRGDKMDFLTSMSSDDYMMQDMARKLAAEDDFYDSFSNKNYRGNMNTTSIRTQKGRTIMLQHDVTSPRPYSRIHLISGTKGMAREYPEPMIATGHEWLSSEEMKEVEEKFTPEIVKKMGEMAKEIGGHGGMDFLMDWRLIDCLRNGLPMDMDVYDAALWSAITPLSINSVASRSNSVDVPDFTRGAWETNDPLNMTVSEAEGTTGMKPC
jgi:hypothetical protein